MKFTNNVIICFVNAMRLAIDAWDIEEMNNLMRTMTMPTSRQQSSSCRRGSCNNTCEVRLAYMCIGKACLPLASHPDVRLAYTKLFFHVLHVRLAYMCIGVQCHW